MQSTQQKRAAIYLQDMAKQLDSRVLSAVAGQVAADTFSKVKKRRLSTKDGVTLNCRPMNRLRRRKLKQWRLCMPRS